MGSLARDWSGNHFLLTNRRYFHPHCQERGFGTTLYSKGEWLVHSYAQYAPVAVQLGESGQLAKEGALVFKSQGNKQLPYLEGVYVLTWLHFRLKKLILSLAKMS